MNRAEHIARHVKLHKNLDELLGDYIGHTGKLPSETNLMKFIEWSFKQTKDPTEVNYGK